MLHIAMKGIKLYRKEITENISPTEVLCFYDFKN
jgi:hypothetical protein